MHRNLAVSLVFYLPTLTISSDRKTARESAGEPQAKRKSCGLRPKDGREPRLPRGLSKVPSGGLPSNEIRQSRQAALTARRSKLSLRKAQVPLCIKELSVGPFALPARDGWTEWAAGAFGLRGQPRRSGDLRILRGIGWACRVTAEVRFRAILGRPGRTGRACGARLRKRGARGAAGSSRAAVPPSGVGSRFLRGPTSAPLPLSGSPGPIAGA